MTFTEETWDRTAGIREAIYAHPFVAGLGDGSLPRANFAEYMAQDALYLADYARALAALATQAAVADEVVFWAGAAREAIVVERQLHAAHVELDAAVMNPTCRAYTSYLLGLATRGSYRVAAAGVLPCFWIYSDVGKRLLARAGDLADHPYGDWIGLYADEAFDAEVEKAKAIVNALAAEASPDEAERMHEAFATASRYEWMFWDAAWRLETWPV
ncbi:MAG: thiaminase II [Propionibacteriaceae bacterium]|nr:thiaminase II [Propionibacteriaceae bacterium]